MKLRKHDVVLSHDSFLDVVSNVVGVLVLVAIAVIVNAGEVQIALGAPVLRDPPDNAKRVIYECSRGRVFPLDEDSLDHEFDAAAEREIARMGRKFEGSSEIERFFDDTDVGSRDHRIRIPKGGAGIAWKYELRDDAEGEGAARILDPDSEFQRHVQGMDSKDTWIWFIVRDDSFETFRAARNLARSRGLAVGWGPMQGKEPVVFSRFGGGEGNKVQ